MSNMMVSPPSSSFSPCQSTVDLFQTSGRMHCFIVEDKTTSFLTSCESWLTTSSSLLLYSMSSSSESCGKNPCLWLIWWIMTSHLHYKTGHIIRDVSSNHIMKMLMKWHILLNNSSHGNLPMVSSRMVFYWHQFPFLYHQCANISEKRNIQWI